MIKTLTTPDIEEVLSSEYIGRIGFSDKDRMFILPVTYCYDKESLSILGHSCKGTKIDIMRNNPEVCFQVDNIRDFSDWKSVLAWGVYEELKGSDARNAVHTLVTRVKELVNDDKHPHVQFLNDISKTGAHSENTIIYRIRLSEFTGKYEDE
ncbi:MAG: pyridoxamine 5'-phosphate oxidase family protein [Cytophagaceae bacterium]